MSSKLFLIHNDTQYLDKGSSNSSTSFRTFRQIEQSGGEHEVVSVKISEIRVNLVNYIMIQISDLSDAQTKGLARLQKFLQQKFTNALSHERMTPLNSIVNGSARILKFLT